MVSDERETMKSNITNNDDSIANSIDYSTDNSIEGGNDSITPSAATGKTRFLGILTFLLVALLGFATLAALAISKKGPTIREAQIQAQPARCIPINVSSVVPRVILRGEVRPASIWSAVAETGGRVIRRNPRLAKGAALEKGAELLALDPFDYEVNLTRASAEKEQLQASLEEIETRASNLADSLALEKERLVLVQNEFKRQSNLLDKNSTSRASRDKAELDLLAQRQKCMALQQNLDLIPSQKKAISARLKGAEANASEAQRLVSRTVISMPFTGRIGQVTLEKGQFIPKGQALFKVYGTDMAEIYIRCTFMDMKSIIPFEGGLLDGTSLTDSNFVDSLGLKALVRMKLGDLTPEWEARVSRVDEGLDPSTRTLGIILEVKDPYMKMIPGKRPPLFPGMFVEAVISGPPREKRVSLPREAVRDGFVYCLDNDNLLRKVFAVPEFHIGDQAIFDCQTSEPFKGFSQAVVSDLAMPLEGMKITPVVEAR
jgi:multidrug efflux pump subunit AcrA (membrane-fusion protein)